MNRRHLAGAALGLVVVAALIGLGLRQRSRARLDADRAGELLGQARAVIAAARSEDLVALAAEGFRQAGAEVERGTRILATGDGTAALPVAESALAAAQAAREEALRKAPVSRAAVLRAFHNTVLYRAAAGVGWSDATMAMSLFDRDRIATKEKSRAIVHFEEGNEMRVEENSVMVVERVQESRADATLSMSLSVPEGSVRSMVQRKEQRDVRLEINLPNGGVVVDTAGLAGGRAEIGTRVAEGASNRVAVYIGAAEVVGKGGERVTVGQNQYAEVTPEGKLTAPRELPSSAITLLPGRNATVYVSSHRPDVTFKWKVDGACDRYRLEVARDRDFLDPVLDQQLRAPSFTYGNLKPGRYLWRVSCLSAADAQGAYTETSTFDVVIDNVAPKLAILAPQANQVVAAGMVEARCRAEGDSTVFINGEEAVRGARGEFSRQVALVAGVNTLVFEAVDAAGNVMYNSLLVTRRTP